MSRLDAYNAAERNELTWGAARVELETDSVLQEALSALVMADRSHAWREERDVIVQKLRAVIAQRKHS